jgi:hypothetical protein
MSIFSRSRGPSDLAIQVVELNQQLALAEAKVEKLQENEGVICRLLWRVADLEERLGPNGEFVSDEDLEDRLRDFAAFNEEDLSQVVAEVQGLSDNVGKLLSIVRRAVAKPKKVAAVRKKKAE